MSKSATAVYRSLPWTSDTLLMRSSHETSKNGTEADLASTEYWPPGGSSSIDEKQGDGEQDVAPIK